jgi:myo-inositol 2-dehydrogenase/D-chiro-inositol 1-dehydrogenase
LELGGQFHVARNMPYVMKRGLNVSFKICIIGCGNMAINGHGPSYRKYAALYPDVELAACCDIDEMKASFFKREFGFGKFYTDMDVMLDTEKPDAVCMVVPAHLTSTLAVKILEKGYPLLLEKPPGMNRNETIDIIRAARKRNVSNQVAFNRRYIHLVRQLKGLLEEHNGIDRSMNIQYKMLRVGRKDIDFATTAIHGIDLVRFLAASDYRTIRFHYQEMDHIGKNVVNVNMFCEFESGAYAQLGFFPVSGSIAEHLEINVYNHTFSLNLPLEASMASPGRLLYKENNEVKMEFADRDILESMEGFVLSGFYEENKSFFEDIRNGRKPTGDIESGLQSVEIVDCIRNRIPEYRLG